MLKDIFNKLIISNEDEEFSLFTNDNNLFLCLYLIIYGDNNINSVF